MQFGGGLGISDPTNGERSPPTTNKYARRGDIVFVGGGAALVIGLSIFGGLTYFDTFHTSLPKPVAEKPESLRTFGFSKRRSPSCCLSGSHSARSAAPGHRRVLTLTVRVRRTGSRKFSSPRRAGAASMASCSTRWCTAPISRNSMAMCSDGGGLQLKRVLPLQRHHPHPEHHLVADVDVVFTHEGQLAVVADTKHRQAGGYCPYRIAVPHIHRQIVLRDQNAAARVDVKGAGVDLLRLDERPTQRSPNHRSSSGARTSTFRFSSVTRGTKFCHAIVWRLVSRSMSQDDPPGLPCRRSAQKHRAPVGLGPACR